MDLNRGEWKNKIYVADPKILGQRLCCGVCLEKHAYTFNLPIDGISSPLCSIYNRNYNGS